MKPRNNKLKAGILLVAILMLSLGLYVYSRNSGLQNDVSTGNGQGLNLVRPAFAASVASATTFLEDQAGISIYMNAGMSLDLSQLPPFRTIESNTSDYVIGSISIPNSTGTLEPTEDAHCFVHKTGWIVVYYLKSEPVSKIIDWSWWNGIQFTSNKLQQGLKKIADAYSANTAGAQYYDFAYPSANKFMLIVKAQLGNVIRGFNVTLPATGFTFWEESWSCHASNSAESDFYIDQLHLYEIVHTQTIYGKLSTLMTVAPDVHNVWYRDYGAEADGVCLVLAYQEG